MPRLFLSLEGFSNMKKLTYHNKAEVKEHYIARMNEHVEADKLVKGQYWEDGKGCAVGCLVHGSDHSELAKVVGWPEWLCHLMDEIFEGLPNERAQLFPSQLLSAVPVGKDISLVKNRFLHWLLMDECLQYAGYDKQVQDAIKGAAQLHADVIEGITVTDKQWDTARAAAWDTARAAAGDAARAATWAAAWAAARATTWDTAMAAAGDAAWDTAMAAAWAAGDAGEAARAATWAAVDAAGDAVDAAWERQADKLIELLEDTHV